MRIYHRKLFRIFFSEGILTFLQNLNVGNHFLQAIFWGKNKIFTCEDRFRGDLNIKFDDILPKVTICEVVRRFFCDFWDFFKGQVLWQILLWTNFTLVWTILTKWPLQFLNIKIARSPIFRHVTPYIYIEW